MKKLILSLVLLIVILSSSDSFAQSEQSGKEITCEEANKILKSADCPFSAADRTSVWCYQEEFKGGTLDDAREYMRAITSQPPDYILEKNFDLCDWPQTDQEESEQQDIGQAVQPEEKENLVIKALGGFPVFIGDWFSTVSTGWGMQEFFYQNELFADEVLFGRDRREITEEKEAKQKKDNLQFQQSRKEILDKQGLADLDEVFNRIPVIKDALPDYKTGEWQQNSPFRLDILRGQAQIKYPGESEWRDIKAGDKIPPGSTIFTGMDATTVLSIKDKGVVQVLPFTEVTITEEGLADSGKTTTEIKLRTGEIELNVEGGVYTAPLIQVFTTNVVAGVRGTHLWVSYDKDNKLSTVGVYEGKVEVKVLGSDKTTLVSPNGDKPGVVVVAQKFSPIKLAIVGIVLVAIVGGIVWLIKKKTLLKSSKKR